MAPAKPTAPRTLTVRQTYEPTRIAALCLADAYARVVPNAYQARRVGSSPTLRHSTEEHLSIRRKPNEPS